MADTVFDLSTFSNLPLVATDENGNPITSLTVTWSVPDATVVTLTDNGNGTATLVRSAAAGGTVVVTATVANADGTTASGTLTVTLSAVTPSVTTLTIVPGSPS